LLRPSDLSPEEREALIRSCWYSHDARWFNAVAQEFDLETANRLNKRVCRALGQAEMRRLIRALGIVKPTTVHELVQVVEVAFSVFAPPPLAQLEIRAVDDRSYQAWMKQCFIHDNVTKAGIGRYYVCAAHDRVQGWHDALGLPLAAEPPTLPCAKVQGRECRPVVRVVSGSLRIGESRPSA
jgi:hypothetical protein